MLSCNMYKFCDLYLIYIYIYFSTGRKFGRCPKKNGGIWNQELDLIVFLNSFLNLEFPTSFCFFHLMQTSEKNSGWEDLIFIPPGKSHSQHIQEVTKR